MNIICETILFALSLFYKIRRKQYLPMLKGSIYRQEKDGGKEKMGLTWNRDYVFYEICFHIIIFTSCDRWLTHAFPQNHHMVADLWYHFALEQQLRSNSDISRESGMSHGRLRCQWVGQRWWSISSPCHPVPHLPPTTSHLLTSPILPLTCSLGASNLVKTDNSYWSRYLAHFPVHPT